MRFGRRQGVRTKVLDKLCRVRSVHAGEARARVLCVYRSPTPRT